MTLRTRDSSLLRLLGIRDAHDREEVPRLQMNLTESLPLCPISSAQSPRILIIKTSRILFETSCEYIVKHRVDISSFMIWDETFERAAIIGSTMQ